MRHFALRRMLPIVCTALVALYFVTLTAHAHGDLEVGDYELVIGFRNEPAYQGEPNGLDLRVTRVDTGEPVSGLADTLQAEIIYGSARREVEIRPQFGSEGAYTADVLPSAAGDYTWHIWGNIEGTPVDVELTSGPDTFSPVRAKSDVSFPGAEPATVDLPGQVAAANNMARIALVAAVLGLLVGLAGVAVALRASRA